MTAIIGIAAVVSGIIVFCGSVWMLLTLVIGARLAYFVTASVTLAFVLIMGAVWSFGDVPLGPVGVQPKWNQVAIAESQADVNFGPASSYPDSPWFQADTEDAAQAAQVAELKSAATDYLQDQIDDGKITAFETASDALVTDGSERLIESDGKQYGAVAIEPAEGKKGEDLFVVMSYDPGNPFLPARQIALGALVLFILHLIGLSRAEAAARRTAEATA